MLRAAGGIKECTGTHTLCVYIFSVCAHSPQEEIIVMSKGLTFLTYTIAFKKYMQHG
jgi:hypothetical protein